MKTMILAAASAVLLLGACSTTEQRVLKPEELTSIKHVCIIQNAKVRPHKLLLKQSEINKLIGKTERAGYTIVPLNLHYTRGKIKVEIGLAKGKKQHDNRQSLKDADWKREKQRLMKNVR